ncbi:MAG: DNA cytosine methyltransferase [Planctomycetota bacterium]
MADLFCGAGGTSIGAEMTGDVEIKFAVNHWDRAIETHSANFPEPRTRHIQEKLGWVNPGEAENINLLFASPECTHHSRARGGRPTSDQQRAGAWQLMPWIEYHRPSHIVVENISEFREWGPVDPRTKRPLKSKKCAFFDSWIMAIRAAGYKVEFQELNAADYGAATSRNRLFVIAKKGRRTPCFPEPTHCRDFDTRLPGMEMTPWRGAFEIIDWSIPLPSVFGRKRPLADKTLARITKGLDRHVAPAVIQLRNHGTATSLNGAIGTITAGGLHHGLSVPFIATVNHGDSGGRRSRSAQEPLPTFTSNIGEGIVAPFITIHRGQSISRDASSPLSTVTAGGGHHGVAVPMTVQFDNKSGTRVPKDAGAPINTVTTKNGQAIAVPLVMGPQSGAVAKSAGDPVPTVVTSASSHLFVPWITSYYGSENNSGMGQPCPTITTRDRHAATVAIFGDHLPAPQTDAERELQARMRELGVVDIGFRMMSNGELANAQGFPMDYQFCGTKKDVTKQIGNSVSPPVAKAITETLLGN